MVAISILPNETGSNALTSKVKGRGSQEFSKTPARKQKKAKLRYHGPLRTSKVKGLGVVAAHGDRQAPKGRHGAVMGELSRVWGP